MEQGILNTRFELNVKGMTNFPGLLNIRGTLTSMAGGDTSEYTHQCVLLYSIILFLPAPGSDFANLIPITFANETNIRLVTLNDHTTLEYNEYVILTFTPGNPAVIPDLERQGEYVRTSAIVNIIDNDRKC